MRTTALLAYACYANSVKEEGRCWIQRSPAMAAGLTDYIESIRDVLMMIPLFRETTKSFNMSYVRVIIAST
jgi:hypothetical protein